MKIYFSASRFYREQYAENYQKIVDALKKGGGEVVDNSKTKTLDGSFQVSDSERTGLYKSMLKSIDKADLCVFEASYPSTLHIGHEITLALGKSKPTIVLYTKGHEPILFKGISEQKIYWIEYDSENLAVKLDEAVEQAKKEVDVRFNFFVSPKILAYLDWVAEKRMIPRSVFLRNLIEKEMRKDKGFRQ